MRILGASVLSAAGSLPLQILPFLILTLVAEGRVDIAFAGWVGSAFLVGMLSSALLLPVMKVSRLNRWQALAGIAWIGIALMLTVVSKVLPVLLLLWYSIGIICGGLQFLGATAASAAVDKPKAFALRLATALIVASLVIVALAQFAEQKSYTALANFLMGAFVIAAIVGAVLYKDAEPTGSSATNPAAQGVAVRNWAGLLVVFAFFAGQPGFWAYAMQSASQRGLDLHDAAMVIAASKVISAMVLLYGSKSKSSPSGLAGLLVLGCAVAAGILAMTYSAVVAAFFLGFLIWELALNVLSARLQGLVVAASPGHAGIWITGAIQLGAATGPILHGAAIGINVEVVFIAYAATSAFFPLVWAARRSLRGSAGLVPVTRKAS